MEIIVYDRMKQHFQNSEELKSWAIQNLLEEHFNELDENYYDTDMNGWEALFAYLTYEGFHLMEEMELQRLIRLENMRYNMGKQGSELDEHFFKGFYELDESEEEPIYEYHVKINNITLNKRGSIVEASEYPTNIIIYYIEENPNYKELEILTKEVLSENKSFINKYSLDDINIELELVDVVKIEGDSQ